MRVFRGVNHELVSELLAYEPAFRGGVRVAFGETVNPTRPLFLAGAGPSGGPRIKVLRPDLEVTELSVSWPGCTAGTELYEEVMQSLVDLAEVRPEAVQLMGGRTFARAVH